MSDESALAKFHLNQSCAREYLLTWSNIIHSHATITLKVAHSNFKVKTWLSNYEPFEFNKVPLINIAIII